MIEVNSKNIFIFIAEMLRSETNNSIITFDPKEGFLRVTTKSGSDIQLEDAKHDFEVAAKMVNYAKVPVLADSRNYTDHTKEVRDFYASKEMGDHMSAMAVMVDSLATRIIGNFFIITHKPFFPTKLFTEEKEAIKWINEILVNDKIMVEDKVANT